MFAEAHAVLWAQFRILRNLYPRRAPAQMVVVMLMAAIWYGLWSTGGILAGLYVARTRDIASLAMILPWTLLIACVYWQLIPILMLSTGAGIELKQVLAYPIPKGQLFGLDVTLRLSTAFEMLIVLAGGSVGLFLNPLIPWWAPAGFLLFAAMNLLLSVGVRSVLNRLLAQKHLREAAVLLFVLAAGLPQIALMGGGQERIQEIFDSPANPAWPWTAAGSIAAGKATASPWLVLLLWTALAYVFGRRQFERGLRFDHDEAASRAQPGREGRGWADQLFRLPGTVFRDPLGAIVEKEIRFLTRAPRFRLAFMMGFSFGLLVWLPMAIRGAQHSGSVVSENYLTFVSVYAVLLLSEVTFWNCFGLDRGAAQMYYVTTVPLSTVLIAKNITAAAALFLEICAVALACFVLRMPMTVGKVLESFTVTAVFTLYVLAVGNLGSCRYPRPIDPKQSWRSSSAARFQALLLLIYPVIAIPLALAYVARWGLESEAAFYGVLGFDAALGAVVYWLALDSATASLNERRESVLAALSERGGPIAA